MYEIHSPNNKVNWIRVSTTKKQKDEWKCLKYLHICIVTHIVSQAAFVILCPKGHANGDSTKMWTNHGQPTFSFTYLKAFVPKNQ